MSWRFEKLAKAGPIVSRDEVGRLTSLATSGPGSLQTAADGRFVAHVYMHGPIDAVTVSAVTATGARIQHQSQRWRVLVVAGTPATLLTVGRLPQVKYVEEVIVPLKSNQWSAAARQPAPEACDPVISEGDNLHRTAEARSAFGVNGSGVTVGIISDSFNVHNGESAGILAGELPGAANPCGYTTPARIVHEGAAESGSDEGRAMAEIVHDLAPAAQLLFSAQGTYLETADRMIEMSADYGAQITVDDIVYFEEPWFQEGFRGLAAKINATRGTTHFAAAGNYNVTKDGRSVNGYESVFRPMPCPDGVPEGTCHDFDPGSGSDATSGHVLKEGQGGETYAQRLALQWSEPWHGVGTNLDLYLMRGKKVVGESRSDNEISPREFLSTADVGVHSIVVRRRSGTSEPRLRLQWYSTHASPTEWAESFGDDRVGVTTVGEVGDDTFNLAASDNGSAPEVFSSRGPSTHYWAPVRFDGQPAEALTVPREHFPEATGADGTLNSFFGTDSKEGHRFFGTSAAAPHAAAIAALALSRNSTKTPSEVRQLLTATAQAMPGYSPSAVGAGFLDAYNAVDRIGAQPVGHQIRTWGSDLFGQLDAPEGLRATAVAAGLHHSLAIEPSGTVIGWGANFYGERSIPSGLTHVVAVGAADVHSVALKRDGTVVAWGASPYGETDVPASLTDVIAISTDPMARHTLALKRNGTVAAWGGPFWGATTVPDGLSDVVAIAAGGTHNLALKADGTVAAWGSNFYGESIVPQNLTDVIAISAGHYHSLALRSDGTLVAWGAFAYDQYGQRWVYPIYVPDDVTDVVAIESGGYHNLALTHDGSVVAWGANFVGQTNVPADLGRVTAMAGGGTFNVVLVAD